MDDCRLSIGQSLTIFNKLIKSSTAWTGTAATSHNYEYNCKLINNDSNYFSLHSLSTELEDKTILANKGCEYKPQMDTNKHWLHWFG